MDLLRTRVEFSGWTSFSPAARPPETLAPTRAQPRSVTRWDSAEQLRSLPEHDADRPVRCSVVSHTLGAQPVRADCTALQGGAQQPGGLPLRRGFALHEVFRHNMTMLLRQRGVVIDVLFQSSRPFRSSEPRTTRRDIRYAGHKKRGITCMIHWSPQLKSPQPPCADTRGEDAIPRPKVCLRPLCYLSPLRASPHLDIIRFPVLAEGILTDGHGNAAMKSHLCLPAPVDIDMLDRAASHMQIVQQATSR